MGNKKSENYRGLVLGAYSPFISKNKIEEE